MAHPVLRSGLVTEAPDLEPAAAADAVARARARHATIALDRDTFLRHVLARVSPATPLEALHIEDLYLACACGHGDVPAIAALDDRIVAAVRTAIARQRASAELGDEVAQRLRDRLLVGDARRGPRIAEYAGRGPLDAWLRVAAVRQALNLHRDRRTAERRVAEHPAPPPLDPDLEVLHRQVRQPFRAALHDAFRALGGEHRLVLRLHFKDGVNLDGIAARIGTSRATAGRRLQAAREQLREQTIRLLGERLAVESTDIEGMLSALSGEIDISRVFAVAPNRDDARLALAG